MDFKPILNELSQSTPSRDIIIEELDVLTDFLRAGYPTTDIIEDLFNLFTKLINFSQWHIQQDTLSCAKYIFENSTLTQDQKKEALLKHPEFTKKLGELLTDPKREVREMSSQCIGHLALHIGQCIIDEEFNIRPFLFEPHKTAFALEGQQMALGRLSTSFRIISPESLKIILPLIINCDKDNVITNPSDNGYVFWYSTRALLLLVSSKCDPILNKYRPLFEKSREFVISNFKDEIMKCAYSRLMHPYANVRRCSSEVVSSIFISIQSDREKFIDSLLPSADMKWIAREGLFAAIGGCLSLCSSPLDSSYVDNLCQKLSDFVKDPIACDDKTPVTQKGNANGMAGKSLVQVLHCHDSALYEKYVKPVVQYLLESPVAALIDSGVICLSELQKMNGSNGNRFDLNGLYLSSFKNICHASFPIRDLSRRTIPASKIVQESFDELLATLVNFGRSVDPEVRESVCKSIQMVSGMTTAQLPQSVVDMAEELAGDSNDSVAAAALDVLRAALDAQNVAKVPELVRRTLSGDNDDAICAAIRLLKSSINLYRNAVIDDAYSISPLLAFHTLASMSPSVATAAQQLLIIIAGNDQETDEGLVQEVSELDFDSIDVSELDETVEKCVSNKKAPNSMLKIVVDRYCDNLGGKSPKEIIADFVEQDPSSINELIEYICGEEKADIIAKLAILLNKASELSESQIQKVLQVVADTFADEAIDVEEKQPLLLALDEMRRLPLFAGEKRINIPDPTPISLSHHTETFAKSQSI